jgi:hypothetical protein
MSGHGHDRVPVAPLREAFLRSGVTAYELARRLGWTKPDPDRVEKQLGLRRDTNGHGSSTTLRGTTSQARALEIIRALDIDPVDVEGL